MGSETTKEHGTSENLWPRKMPPSAQGGHLKKLRLQEIAISVSVDRERGLRTNPLRAYPIWRLNVQELEDILKIKASNKNFIMRENGK